MQCDRDFTRFIYITLTAEHVVFTHQIPALTAFLLLLNAPQNCRIDKQNVSVLIHLNLCKTIRLKKQEMSPELIQASLI